MKRLKREYNELIVNIFSGIMSFFCVYSINKILFEENIIFSNSIIALFCWIVCYKIFLLLWEKRNLSNQLFSAFSGGVFSILFVVGKNIARNNSSGIIEWKTICCIIGVWPLFVGIIRWIEYICKKYEEKYEGENWFRLRKYFLVWGLIFIAWLPIWFADFPGVYGYDAVYQTKQFYANTGLNGHHPIAHTALSWFLLSLGECIFGTYEAGMALYALVQMLFMSSIFAYTVVWLGKYRISLKLQVVFAAFYAIVPIHGLLAISFTKDVMFSGLFLLVIVLLIDIFANPMDFWNKKSKQTGFVIIVFLMCLFRNNGIYGFFVCIPFFVLGMKKYWKRAVGICLCSVLLYVGFMGPFSTFLGVEKGNFREALSIPMQQMSRAMLNNINELTDEEKEYVENVIPNYKNYLPRISDNVKGTFQQEIVNKDIKEFLKNWLYIGIKCPITYLDAFLENTLAFWYPDMQYPDPFMWHSYLEYENTPYNWHNNGEYNTESNWLLIEKNSIFPRLDKLLHNWVYTASHQKLPIVSMLFSPGFYIWIFLLVLLACVFYKKWKFLPACMMLFGFWGTILLGPAGLVRYAYPIIVTMPVMIMMLLKILKDKKQN